jgi:hypothetical protein
MTIGEFSMAFSLYDATVANFAQILGAVSGFLDKGLSHFKEKGTNPEEIVDARLYADMLPFASRSSRWHTIRVGRSRGC